PRPTHQGRGYTPPPRNETPDGTILVQQGNLQLIAEKISKGKFPETEATPLFKEFEAFLNQKKQQDTADKASPSFAKIIGNETEDNLISYHKGKNTEVILLLDFKDLQWKDDPWILMQKYLDSSAYAGTSYKPRSYYENILKASETCEISHFSPGSGYKKEK
ncbi:hypothetical protein PSY31_22120, partial [Shigella flexneri]|nr:hypothetical protein [Shigella flexneri]